MLREGIAKSIRAGQSWKNEEYKARYLLVGCAFGLRFFKNDDSDFLPACVKMVPMNKVDPEPSVLDVLPEEITNILQYAHACAKGIISPEELGAKLAEFEKWLDSTY